MHTQCPKCQAWNPEGRSTCAQCGTAMPAGPSAALPEAPGAGGDAVVSWMTLVIRAGVMFNLVGAFVIAAWVVWTWSGHEGWLLREPHPAPPVCLSTVNNISLGFQMYLADYDDRFPPSSDWSDRLSEYVKNRDVFRCDKADGLECGFAYNASLSGASLADIADPSQVVVVFESERGWNAAGGPVLLPDRPRHLGGDNYGFADGSVTWIKRKKLRADEHGKPIWAKEPVDDSVIWEPVVKESEGEQRLP